MTIYKNKYFLNRVDNYANTKSMSWTKHFIIHNAVDSMPTITFGNNLSSKNDEIVTTVQGFIKSKISVYRIFISFFQRFLCIFLVY